MREMWSDRIESRLTLSKLLDKDYKYLLVRNILSDRYLIFSEAKKDIVFIIWKYFKAFILDKENQQFTLLLSDSSRCSLFTFGQIYALVKKHELYQLFFCLNETDFKECLKELDILIPWLSCNIVDNKDFIYNSWIKHSIEKNR